ncbi:MAG: tRNA (adenosine(37)-N6)-threonylcarbamoyltransferase complex transferase subunit TsaD [Patescibacteria group bacterium]
MKVLGIETSCDETAVAVLEITKTEVLVLSHVVSSQVDLHKKYGGVVPEVAAREHTKQFMPIFEHALEQASCGLDDVVLIAATQGPGLASSLMVGFEAGKAFSFGRDIPFVAVNHLAGHIFSWALGKSGEKKDHSISFPFLSLIISGGHTELIFVEGFEKYTLLGRTVDDAVGEAFDKTAKMMGLSYPGGPQISNYALKGNREEFALPRPMLQSGDYQFSFAGLKTAVLYELQKHTLDDKIIADMAASFEQAVADVLVTKAARAIDDYGVESIAVVGGVSANSFLREQLGSRLQNCNVLFPEMTYTGDNAAMIAYAGYLKSAQNNTDDFKSLSVNPNLRIA